SRDTYRDAVRERLAGSLASFLVERYALRDRRARVEPFALAEHVGVLVRLDALQLFRGRPLRLGAAAEELLAPLVRLADLLERPDDRLEPRGHGVDREGERVEAGLDVFDDRFALGGV